MRSVCCLLLLPSANVGAAGANLMGSDLYNNLIKYFVNHLKTLRTVCFPYDTPMSRTVYLSASPSHQASDALQDEALLRYYAQEWDRYTTGANYINRLFT